MSRENCYDRASIFTARESRWLAAISMIEGGRSGVRACPDVGAFKAASVYIQTGRRDSNDAGPSGRRRRADSHGYAGEVGRREATRPTVDVWLLLKLKISIPIRTPGFIEAQFVSLLQDNTYSSRGQ